MRKAGKRWFTVSPSLVHQKKEAEKKNYIFLTLFFFFTFFFGCAWLYMWDKIESKKLLLLGPEVCNHCGRNYIINRGDRLGLGAMVRLLHCESFSVYFRPIFIHTLIIPLVCKWSLYNNAMALAFLPKFLFSNK